MKTMRLVSNRKLGNRMKNYATQCIKNLSHLFHKIIPERKEYENFMGFSSEGIYIYPILPLLRSSTPLERIL